MTQSSRGPTPVRGRTSTHRVASRTRATSAVLDATLFLLLVGAAIMTLTLAPNPVASADAADATADALTTATASLEYALLPGDPRPPTQQLQFPRRAGPGFRRTAHGTLAGHLAAASLDRLTVDGARVSRIRDRFVTAARNATRQLTRRREQLASVRAVWQPYRDAPVQGAVRVGPRPRPTTTVHAATIDVPSGLPTARPTAIDVATAGNFSAVGSAVASRVVRGLFPRAATRAALVGDYPVDQLVTYRYSRFGAVLGVDARGPALEDDRGLANERLTEALGDRFADDMRRQFDSPDAAARAVDVDSVRITVRTWSP
jgi:hypothetical protein